MKHLLALFLSLLFLSPAFAEDKKERVVDIYMQSQDKADYSVKFYIWVTDKEDGDVCVENHCDKISVGYDIDVGSLYITSDGINNLMLFVHPYDEKNEHCRGCVTLWFGGSRPEDINIYLPKNCTHKIRLSKIKYKKPVEAKEKK
jgi:hypothetical protein